MVLPTDWPVLGSGIPDAAPASVPPTGRDSALEAQRRHTDTDYYPFTPMFVGFIDYMVCRALDSLQEKWNGTPTPQRGQEGHGQG